MTSGEVLVQSAVDLAVFDPRRVTGNRSVDTHGQARGTSRQFKLRYIHPRASPWNPALRVIGICPDANGAAPLCTPPGHIRRIVGANLVFAR